MALRFQRAEQERTGIKNLRVCYNGAFGYYIEITKSNLANVPADYIRRQTMTNAERYVTEELRQREKQILHAEENALAREEELFRGLVEAVLAEAGALARGGGGARRRPMSSRAGRKLRASAIIAAPRWTTATFS